MLYFQADAGSLWQHFKPKSRMQTGSKVGAMKSEVTRAASKARLIRCLHLSNLEVGQRWLKKGKLENRGEREGRGKRKKSLL